MKKIKSILKKTLVMVGAFWGTLYGKVIAITPLYGPPFEPIEPKPEPILNIGKVVKWSVIPIAFITGAIVYFKKSSSSTPKKLVTILIVLAIIVLVCFGINSIR